MSKINQQVSVWFPDAEVLEKIQKVAKKNDRGIGYTICQAWKKLEELEVLEKIRKGEK